MIRNLYSAHLYTLNSTIMQSTSGDKTREVQLSVREALSSKKEEPQKLGEVESFNSPDNSDEDEANFDARMRRQILRRRQELGDFPAPTEQKPRRGTLIYLTLFIFSNTYFHVDKGLVT